MALNADETHALQMTSLPTVHTWDVDMIITAVSRPKQSVQENLVRLPSQTNQPLEFYSSRS
jgi:hypothetical protein